MKRWGMLFALMAVIGLVNVGCDSKKEEAKEKEGTTDNGGNGGGSEEAAFTYTEWNAWNGFGEGSSVTYQLQNTDQMKMWMRYTVTKKEDDKITLKNESKMDMGGKEGEWKAGTPDPKIVKKPAEAAAGGADATCPKCEKKYSDHDAPTWEDGKADVAGNEVATKTMVMKDCKTGDETKGITVSTDVPGWMTKLGQGPVTAFEAK